MCNLEVWAVPLPDLYWSLWAVASICRREGYCFWCISDSFLLQSQIMSGKVKGLWQVEVKPLIHSTTLRSNHSWYYKYVEKFCFLKLRYTSCGLGYQTTGSCGWKHRALVLLKCYWCALRSCQDGDQQIPLPGQWYLHQWWVLWWVYFTSCRWLEPSLMAVFSDGHCYELWDFTMQRFHGRTLTLINLLSTFVYCYSWYRLVV